MVSFLEMRTKEEGHAWWKEAELMNLRCPRAPLGRGPLACDSRAGDEKAASRVGGEPRG